MAQMRIRRDLSESPRKDIGEIDTRAPFQSVRAAASLFGDTISSPGSKPAPFKKSKSHGVLDRQAEFHLNQKELGKIKTQVKVAETAANKALPDLEKAMKTLMELKDKIKAVNASKESIIEETEALKNKSMELEEKDKTDKRDDLEFYRNEYKAAAIELDAVKQELSILRGDFESAMEAKLSALKIADEARLAEDEHSNKANKISQEIESMKEELDQIEKISAEKRAHRVALHDLIQEKETKALNLNGAEDLEAKLAEMNKEIENLKKQITESKEALSDSERRAYSENRSLLEAVKGLKLELANVGKEMAEIRDKETQEQSLETRLRVELQELKLEFEAAVANEVKQADDTHEMKRQLEKIVMEAKKVKEETQEMRCSLNELKRLVEGVKEMERRMEMAVKECEEAKVAERNAQNEIKILSERKNLENAEDKKQKKELLKEEYMDLKEKASRFRKTAELKAAELEEIKANKIAVEKNLNESLLEIEEMDRATEEAFKQAESAEVARSKAVSELKKRRQEQHCS